MTALVSIADAPTNQETGSISDATSGISVALLFLSDLLLLVLFLCKLFFFFTRLACAERDSGSALERNVRSSVA